VLFLNANSIEQVNFLPTAAFPGGERTYSGWLKFTSALLSDQEADLFVAIDVPIFSSGTTCDAISEITFGAQLTFDGLTTWLVLLQKVFADEFVFAQADCVRHR